MSKVSKSAAQNEALELIKRGALKSAVSQLNTMEWNRTGSWRVFRPFYEPKTAPCRTACPAGQNIPLWVDLVKRGKTRDAWKVYVEDCPFPAILGRVCFKFCEARCNRLQYDEPVSINALERFLGDKALEANWRPEETKSRNGNIAIVGAGPAGLSAAYFLMRMGFGVTIYDSSTEVGGLLQIGIPAYRLPKAVLRREIDNNILLSGVGLWLGRKVDERMLTGLAETYDEVIIATGAHLSRDLKIDGEGLPGVMSGLKFLAWVAADGKSRADIKIGPRVAVIGGGNTAIDAARSALRLNGVEQVLVVYRRGEEEMPAHAEEVEQAEIEGVKFMFLMAPVKIRPGILENILTCQKMKLGEPDGSGRRKPVPVEDAYFEIAADTIIKAVGEESGLEGFGIRLAGDAEIVPGAVYRAGEKIIVIGDALSGPSSVAHAVLSGKKAALLACGVSPRDSAGKIVRITDINPDYFRTLPKVLSPRLYDKLRNKNFAEVNLGLGEAKALEEALRCFACGFCNHCDNCYRFCPDGAVRKTVAGYEINYDFCKGCGVCAEECPRGVIGITKEEEAAK